MAEANWSAADALAEWKRLHELHSQLEDDYDAKVAPLKEEFEAKASPVEKQIDEVEQWFIEQSEKDGNDKYESDVGTVTIGSKDKAKISDAYSFYQWVEETQNSELLQKRISVTNLRSYLSDNNGEVPPGLTLETERNAKLKLS